MSEWMLETLQEVIASRKEASPDNSYIARLLHLGTKKIAQKVGEEATETVIAALVEDHASLISESADLLFHLSVLWADKGVTPLEVMQELERRIGMSGLDEKSARQATIKGK